MARGIEFSDKILTADELKKWRSELHYLPKQVLQIRYRTVWQECGNPLRLPGPRAMQELLTYWKVLRKQRRS